MTNEHIDTGFDHTHARNIIDRNNEGALEMTSTAPTQQLPVFDEKTKNATLLHAKSQLISRTDLRLLPTPAATGTWKPTPFSTILYSMAADLDKRGIRIAREQLAVNTDGLKFFGTFDLEYGTNNEYTAALGLRSSNNKSMAIQIAVGARVFVCDNMCFSGDLIALKRKQTSGLNIDQEMHDGLDIYFGHQEQLQANIGRMRAKLYNAAEAERMIFNAFDREILPPRLFKPVIKSYREVRGHSYVSAWQLHNCMTLHAHTLPPQRKFKATTDLGTLFNM